MTGKRVLEDDDDDDNSGLQTAHLSKRQKLHYPLTPDSIPLSPAPSSRDPRPLVYHCSFAPCTRSFTRPCRLAEHERSHTGERPFVCPQCMKSFSRDYHLSRHLSLSHSTKRDYTCSWPACGKAFATTQRRNEHEKTHLKKKEFTCTGYDGCDAVFRKKSTLNIHINKVHLGVKPYSCDKIDPSTNELCLSGYETAGKLREHVKRCHSSVPRFYCSICKLPPQENLAELSLEAASSFDAHVAFNNLQDLLSHKRLYHPTDASMPRPRDASSTSPPKLAVPRRRANQYTSAAVSKNIPSAADLLTGPPSVVSGIRCLKQSCNEVLSEFDALLLHCSLAHGMAEIEVMEPLREREANEGGVFWVGAQYDELDDEEEVWFNSLFDQLQEPIDGQRDHIADDLKVDPNLR
jgi:uncharacterized C2H2 Zn-finger protein